MAAVKESRALQALQQSKDLHRARGCRQGGEGLPGSSRGQLLGELQAGLWVFGRSHRMSLLGCGCLLSSEYTIGKTVWNKNC